MSSDTKRSIVDTVPRNPTSSSVAVGVALAGVGVVAFSFVVASILLRGGVPVQPGWSAVFTGGSYAVLQVDRQSAEAGLRPGDRIQAVAGDRKAKYYGSALALSRIPPGAPYSVAVVSAGGAETLTLRMERLDDGWKPLVPNLLVCAVLYTLGVWIGSVKFNETTARLATLSFLLTVFTFLSVIVAQFPGWNIATSALALALGNFARPLNLAVAYHFFSRFPYDFQESHRALVLRRGMYATAVLLWIPLNVPALAQALGVSPNSGLRILLAYRGDGRPGGLLIPVYETLAAVLMTVALARNYRRVHDPDSRRRIRWAGIGFVATVGVYFIFALLKTLTFLTGNDVVRRLMDLSNDLATAVIALSCVALAYAVTKHRVLGIRVAMRRGVQYLFAKRALQTVVVLPVLIVGVEVMRHPDQGVGDLILHKNWSFYALIIITGVISLRYRKQMRLWLDRRFFFTEVERERVLASLGEEIKNAESEKELCLSAAGQLYSALQPSELYVLLRDPSSHMLRVAYSRDIDAAVRLRDWLDKSGSDRLSNGSVFTLYECEDNADAELLRSAELVVVPLIGTGQVDSGALVLGPKRSEQPYTGRDCNLLKAIGGQIALACEVLHLKRQVQDEERVKIEVLGHLDDRFVQLLNECPECGRCYTIRESTCEHDGASLSLTLPIETTIHGKYRLQRRIGRGGMGVVYEAADLVLDRSVAVKIMVGDLFGNTEAMARFEREARAAAALSHRNVVRVHDFGHLAAGGAYLVMELITGRSWRDCLRNAAIPTPQCSSWMDQLCSAMEVAHGTGIVHRDLKPENIMIADDEPMGRVVVLDFGLAKLRSELAPPEGGLTMPGRVLGTRGYMAPEQRSGKKLTTSADVFALGVICVETLTRRRPPRTGASSRWGVFCLRRIGAAETALHRCVARALSDRPADRPTAGELRNELSAALTEVALRQPVMDQQGDVKTVSIRRTAGRP